MRVFKSKWFERFVKAEGIGDAALLDAAERAERGQIDANLGGEVIKQRIARPGEGRSKGYRTLVLFRRGSRAFFVYGFAKSRRANIDRDELKLYKEAAGFVLGLTDKQLAELLTRGDFLEVKAK